MHSLYPILLYCLVCYAYMTMIICKCKACNELRNFLEICSGPGSLAGI